MKHRMGNLFAHLTGGTKPKAAEDKPNEDDTEAAPGDGEDDPDNSDEPDPEDPEEDTEDEPEAEDDPEKEDTPAAARPNGKPVAGKKSVKQQVAAARKAGAKAERERCGAIFKDKAAAGKEALAAQLAFETSLSPEAAVGILKTAKAGSSLDTAMNGVTQPNLGTGGGNGGADKSAGSKLLESAKKRAEAVSKR